MNPGRFTTKNQRSFVYDPLPSPSYIRLLRRTGQDTDGTLCFTIEAFDIENQDVKYHCLSYTWGNPFANGVFSLDHFNSVNALYQPGHMAPILVNGQALRIQRNLLDALSTIPNTPYPEPPTLSGDSVSANDLIWADAICINQNDIDEKNIQVGMMDKIYSSAAFVLAWLGPEDVATGSGLNTLEVLAQNIDQFRESQIVPFGGGDRENYEASDIPFVSWDDWVALASVYQRQWFRRAWIVQEAVLPQKLIMYCGKKSVSWYQLGIVAEGLRRNEAKLGTLRSRSFIPQDQVAVAVEWNMAEIYKWRNIMAAAKEGLGLDPQSRKYQDEFNLEGLVHCFWTFHASEPKDKIFSLHGLMNVFGESPLRPDYRRSLSSIYTEAVRQMMLDSGTLDVLLSCVESEHRRPELPSWVPDFSLPGINTIRDSFEADKGLVYHASGHGKPDDPVLGVRGFCLGKISQVGTRPEATPRDKYSFNPSWLRLVLSLKTDGNEGPVLSEIIWKTLCMDMSSGSFYDGKKSSPQTSTDLGHQFRIFLLLMILSAADGAVLREAGLDGNSTPGRLPIVDEIYDPFEKMASVLHDLDAIATNDGSECYTPTSEEVLAMWSSLRYTVCRLCPASSDGSPKDIYLPPEVIGGKARIVGNGRVDSSTKLFEKCQGFATAYDLAYGYRHLFTVGDRYLGLGPVSSRAGDEVWILSGLSTPAVLRQVDESAQGLGDEALGVALGKLTLEGQAARRRYRFMGAAYVNGVMNGEAVRDLGENLESIDLS